MTEKVTDGRDLHLPSKFACLLCYCLVFWAFSSAASQAQPAEGWFPEILGGPEATAGGSSSHAETPYLPDYSYAGYHWGEAPLPSPPGDVIEVTDYGAVPGDGRDDTNAIRDALATAHAAPGAVIVRFPEGRFIVRQLLLIERSDLVLQGAGGGPAGTELHFPDPLEEMEEPSELTPAVRFGHSIYSWQGGVIATRMPGDPPPATPIAHVRSGQRGGHTLALEQAAALSPGDVVRINWFNRDGGNGSLLRHVLGTLSVPIGAQLYANPDRPLVTQEVTVTAVEGPSVTIKEPLLHDLKAAWTPTLTPTAFLEEVGIEHLRVTFPDVPYAGHHSEPGYNGLYLTELMHSWVRDVTVVNGDSGVLSRNCKNVTVEGVSILGRGGHYTIHVGLSYGMLIQDFSLRAPSIHNPSFNTGALYSVYTDGEVYAPRLDQHRGVNHQNLFDNLSFPRFRRRGFFFEGSGSGDWKPRAGAFNTFWNLRITDPEGEGRLGEIYNAPYARLVGVRGERPVSLVYEPRAYVEGTNRPHIAVPSLYEYQLKQRLCTGATPSVALTAPSDGATIPEGTPVEISAAIFSGREDVEEVVFLVNGKKEATDTDGSDGWSRAWSAPKPGIYQISAVARGGAAQGQAANCRQDAVEVWVGSPRPFTLSSNYPNPFRRRTTIPYALRNEAHVQLRMYDMLGRHVATPVDEVQEKGRHTVHFEASGLSSGVYFYRLIVNSSAEVGKMVIVR